MYWLFSVLSFYLAIDGEVTITSDVAAIGKVSLPVILNEDFIPYGDNAKVKETFIQKSWWRCFTRKETVHIFTPGSIFNASLLRARDLALFLSDDINGYPLSKVIYDNYGILMNRKNKYYSIVFNQKLSDIIRNELKSKRSFYLELNFHMISMGYMMKSWMVLHVFLSSLLLIGLVVTVLKGTRKKGGDAVPKSEASHGIRFGDLEKIGINECMICLEVLQADDKVSFLACKHCFHEGCLDKWLLYYRHSCPYCRLSGEFV